MSRRNKILLVIVIILILAVLLLLLFLSLRKKPAAETPAAEPALPPVQNLTPRTPAPAPKVSPEVSVRETLAALARTFAERFGSFSNQNNYLNLSDINPLETPDVQKWSATYLNKLRAENPPSGPYYGITTRVINPAVKILDADNAEAVVSTQREETGADGAAKIYYQNLELKFKRLNQRWLVDWVKWQ